MRYNRSMSRIAISVSAGTAWGAFCVLVIDSVRMGTFSFRGDIGSPYWVGWMYVAIAPVVSAASVLVAPSVLIMIRMQIALHNWDAPTLMRGVVTNRNIRRSYQSARAFVEMVAGFGCGMGLGQIVVWALRHQELSGWGVVNILGAVAAICATSGTRCVVGWLVQFPSISPTEKFDH